MINTSRLELAREPMVWWPLAAALLMMFFWCYRRIYLQTVCAMALIQGLTRNGSLHKL